MSELNTTSTWLPEVSEYGPIPDPPSRMDVLRLLRPVKPHSNADTDSLALPKSTHEASLLSRILDGGLREAHEVATAYTAAVGALVPCQISKNLARYRNFHDIDEKSLCTTLHTLRAQRRALELPSAHPWRAALSSCIDALKSALVAKSVPETETLGDNSNSTPSADFMQGVLGPLDRCRVAANERFLGSFASNAITLLEVRSKMSDNPKGVARIDAAIDEAKEPEEATDTVQSQRQRAQERVKLALPRLEIDMTALESLANARKKTVEKLVDAHAALHQDSASEDEKAQSKEAIRLPWKESLVQDEAVHAAYQDVSVSLALLQFHAMQDFALVLETNSNSESGSESVDVTATGTDSITRSSMQRQRQRVRDFATIREMLSPFTAVIVQDDDNPVDAESLFIASNEDMEEWRDKEPTIDSADFMRRIMDALSIAPTADAGGTLDDAVQSQARRKEQST